MPAAVVEKRRTGRRDFAFVVPIGPGPAPFLARTLASLRAQPTSVGVAVCAVEDSHALRATVAEFSDIVDYLRVGPDDGQSAAINEGWAALDADAYGWLNDDDTLHPEATRLASEAFAAGADVVHGATAILEDGELRRAHGDRPVGPHILDDNTVAQPSAFIARSALAAIDLEQPGEIKRSLKTELHFSMDWDLWRRLHLSGARFHALPDTLSITRWYEGTKTSANTLAKFSEYYRVLRRKRIDPRGLWITGNSAVYNLARFGFARALFRPLDRALAALHRSASGDAPPEPGDVLPPLQVFHYDAGEASVEPGDGSASFALPHGAVRDVACGAAVVSFD